MTGPDRGEAGVVLLIVLVALTLLAGLAAAATRISRSAITGLAAERAVMARETLVQSALAAVGSRIGGNDRLPRNGTPTTIALPGGAVQVRLQAAAGLMNPNSSREPTLLAGLVALGARPDMAAGLVSAIMARRRARPGAAAFADRSELAALFAGTPALWARAAPQFTLLGKAREIDPATAPKPLQPLARQGSTVFDLAAVPGRLEREALFELTLTLRSENTGAQSLHAAVLSDRTGRLRVLRLDWPGAEGG